jgi:protein-S-isoprenylcysteine O-methyltransferase Ste14
VISSDAKFSFFLFFQCCVAALAIFVMLFLGPKPWNWAHWFGLAIAVPALVLLLVARFQLGKSFSITPQARKLVTHGIYSKIRNPIYFFGELVMVGFFTVLHRPILLVVPAIVAPIQILRVRKESKVLEEKFGDEYRQYKQSTWF